MKQGSTLIGMMVATMLLVGLSSVFATAGTHNTDDTPRLKDTLRLNQTTGHWYTLRWKSPGLSC
jgi:hypothetical protein